MQAHPINCELSTFDPQYNSINGTPLELCASHAYSLNIFFLANFFLHTSIAVPTDPPTLGVNYTLTCSAMFEGVNTSVTFQWMDPDGNVINPSEFIAISNAGLTSSLQFSPAQQSQGGRYTCQAIVDGFGPTNFAEVEEARRKKLRG